MLVELSPDQIVEAARDLGVDVVLVWVSEDSDVAAAVSQLRWMASALPKTIELWGNGTGVERVDLRDPRFTIVPSWAGLDENLERVRAARTG